MKDLLLRARVVVRTSNMKISRRRLANYIKTLAMVMNLYSAFSIFHIQMRFTRNRYEYCKMGPDHDAMS